MQIRRRRVRIEIDSYELRLAKTEDAPEACVPGNEPPSSVNLAETIPCAEVERKDVPLKGNL